MLENEVKLLLNYICNWRLNDTFLEQKCCIFLINQIN